MLENRPAPKADEEQLRKYYRTNKSAILGGILAVIFLGIVIMMILIGRYMNQHKGQYLTQEDDGAAYANDPNDAIIHSTTGHHVGPKQEYFI